MKKSCTKCGKEYPATTEYFRRDKRKKSGLGVWCRECNCTVAAIWRKRNLEKHREYARQYGRLNKEKRCEYLRKYRKTLRGYVSFLVGDIKTRCGNEKYQDYKNYGGRGIKCLFTANELYDWLIIRNIDPRGLCIHRIDNDGDYTLDNITFLARNEHTKLHRTEKILAENYLG